MWAWEPENPPPLPRPQQTQAGENGGHGLRVQGSTPDKRNARRPIRLRIDVNTDAKYRSGTRMQQISNRRSMGEGFIRRTVPDRRERFAYQQVDSVHVREDELLALAWGCKPSSAHQRKLRVAREAADVIRTKRQAGATESLAGWLRPIEEALAHQSCDGNHELTAALADCAEDSAEAAYRADPTEANARLLLRKRAMERQTSLDHDRDIAERHGLRL